MHREYMLREFGIALTSVITVKALDGFLLFVHQHVPVKHLFQSRSETTDLAFVLLRGVCPTMHVSLRDIAKSLSTNIARYRSSA